MKRPSFGLQGVMIALLALSLGGCQRVPKGNWRIETGRAQLADDQGERRSRIEAVALAQCDARLKLLRHVEAMEVSQGNLVGDYMAQNKMIGSRVRLLVLSARSFATRYRPNEVVEVDMGVNLDEVNAAVREASP